MTDLPDELFDDLQERVSAGAEYLNTHHPDWREKVDSLELAMFSCHKCVLGQLFADLVGDEVGSHGYGYGVSQVLRVAGLDENDLGFDLPDMYCWERPYRDWADTAWETLNDLWIKEIQR